MHYTHVYRCLSHELLRFLRDERPTEAELLACLGGPSKWGRYHVPRKAGLFLLGEDGRVTLSPDHLSTDGRYFTLGNVCYVVDSDEIRVYRPPSNRVVPTGDAGV